MKVNIYQAKTNLSKYISLAEKGEKVYLCRRNVPVAEIKPIKAKLKERTLGVKNPQITISDSFFDPLPKEFLDEFYKDNL